MWTAADAGESVYRLRNGHGLQADDVNISRSGDSVHVSFRLKVERLAKDYILRVTPLL